MAKAWELMVGHSSRGPQEPKEGGRQGLLQAEGPLQGSRPSTALESKIINLKTPWPLEVEGRLEDLSGHGLGAMGSS